MFLCLRRGIGLGDEHGRITPGSFPWISVPPLSLYGLLICVGANFIHGTDDNPLSDIAEKVGSTLIHNISMRRYYDRTGRPLDSKTANFLYRKVWEYSDAASDYSRQEEVDPKLSVEDFCQDKLNRDKEIESGEMRSLVGNAVDMLSGIAACDLDKLSLKYYWMEDDLPVFPLPLC